jgi:hypothetical protein
VTIPAGERVVWLNLGNAAHRVTSETRPPAWSPFVLAPQGERSVRFARAGRFPYLVDGARRGVVIVTRRGKRGDGGGGSGGPRDRPGSDEKRRFHRYEVRVTVELEHNYAFIPPHGTGSQIITVRWRDRYKDVRVRVSRFEDGRVTVSTDGVFPGTLNLIRAGLKDDRTGGTAVEPLPTCEAEIPPAPFASEILIFGEAGLDPQSIGEIETGLDRTTQGEAFDALVRRAEEACGRPGTYDLNPAVNPELLTNDPWLVHALEYPRAWWKLQGRQRVLPKIFRRLARGQSARLRVRKEENHSSEENRLRRVNLVEIEFRAR